MRTMAKQKAWRAKEHWAQVSRSYGGEGEGWKGGGWEGGGGGGPTAAAGVGPMNFC